MIFRRKRSQSGVSAEIEAHIKIETDRLREQGLSEHDACSSLKHYPFRRESIAMNGSKPTPASNPGRHHTSSDPGHIPLRQARPEPHMPHPRQLHQRPPHRVYQVALNQQVPEPVRPLI
jgi:hypothetical protein